MDEVTYNKLYNYINDGIEKYRKISHDMETIFVLHESSLIMNELKPSDLLIEPITQSPDFSGEHDKYGARITHIPTKTMVYVCFEKTYKENQQRALKALRDILSMSFEETI